MFEDLARELREIRHKSEGFIGYDAPTPKADNNPTPTVVGDQDLEPTHDEGLQEMEVERHWRAMTVLSILT